MCTLTFIPKSNTDFILTSNRDEAPDRNTFPPKTYEEEGVRILYPKDAVAGGTWIGCSEKKRVISIMNGGFVAHKRKASYRKSRGLVVKDLLTTENVVDKVQGYNFEGIEPFTIVIIDWNEELRLFQLVWDEEKVHFSQEENKPVIWSSSPLYPSELKSKREKWFTDFLEETPNPTSADLIFFHKNAGDGNAESDLIIDRGYVKTKSITQVIKNAETVQMLYEDLESTEAYSSLLDF